MTQCPTCGRISEDWSSDETLRPDGEVRKARQRRDSEDRALSYRQWRYQFGGGCFVSDIDQVEWRVVDGAPTPVGVLELSRVDGNVRVPESYRTAVIERFTKRDGQATSVIEMAKRLGTTAWVVLFRWDLTEFWVYNLSDRRGWWALRPAAYENWIRALR
ncbi:MAG TPA: hypothetical protein VMU89_14860 [Thermomicrobiaceae bacterium]|nr:hypothetical protein [Thermomicrobiaceae bacterium]